MFKFRLAAGLTAAALALTGMAIAPANAAAVTCNGAKATITYTTPDLQEGEMTAIGTEKADVIAITGAYKSTPVIVYADSGDDIICNLSASNVLVFGGAGKDTFYGNVMDATFYGGIGNDSAYGGNGNDYLYGGPGSDYIVGGAGNDFVSGMTGDDIVFGGAGVDTVVGGTGKDILSGHGKEAKDDKTVDLVYGEKSEIYPLGTLDVVRTGADSLSYLNKTTRAAFIARFDTKTHYFSYDQVITGEVLKNAVLVARKVWNQTVGFWIAS